LINLVGNAVKFASSGDIRVTVGLEHQRTGGPYLRFQVSDQGIGIAPESLERIFSAFEQADSSTAKQFGGTGLGLAISKRLVAMLGGEIGVESQQHQGSTFWFTCRLTPNEQGGPEEAETGTEADQEALTLSGRSLTVLLADDVEFNRILAAAILERAGHNVVCACNGSQALESFASQHFDIVLMDVQMPVMDGLLAARTIRRIESETGRHTPIVALTAYGSEDFRAKCRQAGMDDYLLKPFKAAEMLMVLERCCGESLIKEEPPLSAATASARDDDGEDAAPVFNCSDLLARLGGRRDMIPRFLELFRKGLGQQLPQLAAAAESKTQDALRNSAHAIKGAAANISALRVYDVALRIEQHALEGQLEAAVALIPALHDELDRFERLSREMFP
jgi:CheY-like chemotaxis protein